MNLKPAHNSPERIEQLCRENSGLAIHATNKCMRRIDPGLIHILGGRQEVESLCFMALFMAARHYRSYVSPKTGREVSFSYYYIKLTCKNVYWRARRAAAAKRGYYGSDADAYYSSDRQVYEEYDAANKMSLSEATIIDDTLCKAPDAEKKVVADYLDGKTLVRTAAETGLAKCTVRQYRYNFVARAKRLLRSS